MIFNQIFIYNISILFNHLNTPILGGKDLRKNQVLSFNLFIYLRNLSVKPYTDPFGTSLVFS